MMSVFQDMKTKTKVTAGSVVPILFLFVLGGVALFNINTLVENNRWVEHTYKVLGKSSNVTAAAIDMETGMRGYLLSGKDEFLAPYSSGAKAADERIADLQQTVSDNPKQVARLDEIGDTLSQWRSQVVEPMIKLRREIGDAETMNDMAALVGEARGKVFFDKMRAQLATFIERETVLLKKRRAEFAVAQADVEAQTKVLRDTTGWVNHTHGVLASAKSIISHAVDMETGLRGYMVGGDKEFLEPYDGGRSKFFETLRALQKTVSDNPPQVERLGRAEKLISEWLKTWAEPAIKLRGDIAAGRALASEMREYMLTFKGKASFDAFRAEMAAFAAEEEKLLTKRAQSAKTAEDAIAHDLDVLKENEAWVTHTYKVIDNAKSILAAAVDIETGMRGYLLAGKEEFLEPYKGGIERFDADVAALAKTVSDNPPQVELLGELAGTMAEWRESVTEPAIALRRQIGDAKTMDDMADLVGEARGKVFFDKFRQDIGAFEAEEMSLIEVRKAAAASAETNTNVAIYTSVGLAFVIGLGVAWLIGSGIANPIVRMTEVMKTLAAGDTTVEVDGQQRKDEVGAMAGAVQVFKEGLIENQRLLSTLQDAESREEEQRQREEEARQREQERLAAEAEREARLAEEARQAAIQQEVVQEIGTGLGALVSGDLGYRVTMDMPAEYAALKANFNETGERLSSIVGEIAQVVNGINGSANDINAATSDLSARTENQASNLEQTAAAMEEMMATVSQNAANTDQTNTLINKTKNEAEKSGEVVKEANEAMLGIEKSSKEIGEIVGVIDEIAFQTNLLALNAAVEAARAGDAGKGFAVVATEVRTLAQRSSEAAKEIKTLISQSGDRVDTGVKLVNATGESLMGIITSVTEVSTIMADIASAGREQATGLEEVNGAVSQMDNMTQQNAAMVEENTAAARSMLEETNRLVELMSFFRNGASSSILANGGANSPAIQSPLSPNSAASFDDDWDEL